MKYVRNVRRAQVASLCFDLNLILFAEVRFEAKEAGFRECCHIFLSHGSGP